MGEAPLRSKVHAEATLKKVEDRTLFFDVFAYDEFEKIAEGENQQLIVTVDKFLSRFKRKMVK